MCLYRWWKIPYMASIDHFVLVTYQQDIDTGSPWPSPRAHQNPSACMQLSRGFTKTGSLTTPHSYPTNHPVIYVLFFRTNTPYCINVTVLSLCLFHFLTTLPVTWNLLFDLDRTNLLNSFKVTRDPGHRAPVICLLCEYCWACMTVAQL